MVSSMQSPACPAMAFQVWSTATSATTRAFVPRSERLVAQPEGDQNRDGGSCAGSPWRNGPRNG
eukprot:7812327-Pyramimonas_sp.AAC.1